MSDGVTLTATERGSHLWRGVRGILLGLAVGCLATAVALYPAAAARWLSDDGELAPSSERALHAVAAFLAALAAGALLVRRRWQLPTPRRERIVLGVALIAGSLMISIVGAEAGLTLVHRLVKPLGAERHYFFQHDDVLGWKHRPKSLATFKDSVVRIDADGMRVSGHERGPFRSRVLLLGDSQAFGDGVAAEETFAARLETGIPGLRVLNASVIGYGTDQLLLYFEQRGFQFAPDVTVVTINAYDVRDNLSTHVRSGYAKPRFILTPAGLTLTNVPVPGDGLADRVNRALQHHSHLYRLLGRFGRSTGRQPDDDGAASGRRLALEIYPDDVEMERGVAVTAAILDRLAVSTQRAGSRLLVLFLPYQLDFGDEAAYAARTDRLVRVLQERASSGSFTLVDARAGLAAHPPEKLFRDAMHLSPEGHRRVAALLERALADEKALPRGSDD